MVEHPMEGEALVRRYLSAMERGDIEVVVACFSATGTASSPTYGELPVRDFYTRLFEDSIEVSVGLRSIYAATNDPGRWIAHFDYIWLRKSGQKVETELVDLFHIQDGRIETLRIVFAPPGIVA